MRNIRREANEQLKTAKKNKDLFRRRSVQIPKKRSTNKLMDKSIEKAEAECQSEGKRDHGGLKPTPSRSLPQFFSRPEIFAMFYESSAKAGEMSASVG